jgi:hypothetical protein
MSDGTRIDVVSRSASDVAEALALLVSAMGATARRLHPAEVRADPSRAAAIVLDGADAGVLAALAPAPVLVVVADERAARGVAGACGTAIELGERMRGRAFELAAGEAALWPLAGLAMEEEASRELRPLAGPALEPLVIADSRPVLARVAGSNVLVTAVVPWARLRPPYLLARAFTPTRFLDVLPALVLAREALGERGWRRPRPDAVAIVDDPNLARLRYGYLDYQQAARLAADCDFHLAIGFVPLDYDRTDRSVARFFLAHAARLSLVMHGNDHLKRELAQAVSDDRAAFGMRQALARMRRHEELTGLTCDPVMTMPHGASAPRWVRAMRDAGYAAAITGRAYAFTNDPEAAGAGRLYELMPAETSLYGLPLVSRWPLGRSLLDVLFGAFLGKPACVYTHNQFFAEGWGPFLDAIAFLNERIGPRWASAAEVARGNQLVRRSGDTLVVRAFSNDLVVSVPAWAERVEVEKLGASIPWETERVVVDGLAAEETERSGTRVAASVAAGGRMALRVRFVSTLADRSVPGWERAALSSRARRLLTETRDRLAPVLSS